MPHPRYLRRGRRPSSSGFGEAFASTGAEPECTKSSTLDGVHGGLRPSPLARERRRRSERTWVLEHRSAAETKPKPEIGGRPGPLRYRRCPRDTLVDRAGTTCVPSRDPWRLTTKARNLRLELREGPGCSCPHGEVPGKTITRFD